jgi:hypothetical protein
MGGIYGSSKNAAVRLDKFASEVRGKLAKALAPKIDARLQAMFANGTDPYGKPWAPLKPSTIRRKGGNSTILVRDNNLAPGTYALATGNRLVITMGPKAQYAQDGEPGEREPRMVAPAYGTPKTWKQDAEDAQAEVAKQVGK